eukprot:scaffold3734_cov425-Prasinococcus_capsulatus_cf.AAC.8
MNLALLSPAYSGRGGAGVHSLSELAKRANQPARHRCCCRASLVGRADGERAQVAIYASWMLNVSPHRVNGAAVLWTASWSRACVSRDGVADTWIVLRKAAHTQRPGASAVPNG